MNKLLGTSTYLCGPMDRCPEGGVGWRRRITPMLHDLGIAVFDPTDKPIGEGGPSDGYCEVDKEERIAWIENEDYDSISSFMKGVRGVDLRMVNHVNFMIAHVNADIHMCGSYEETSLAKWEHKPVLVFTEGGKKKTPWWLFGKLNHKEIFGSIEEVVDYLSGINDGSIDPDPRRWFLFDQKRLYGPIINRMVEHIQPS